MGRLRTNRRGVGWADGVLGKEWINGRSESARGRQSRKGEGKGKEEARGRGQRVKGEKRRVEVEGERKERERGRGEEKWAFCDPSIPFTLKINGLSYAMTINKRKGQAFDKVALFLLKPVISHGQLYIVVFQKCTDSQRQKLKVCRLLFDILVSFITQATKYK